MYEVVEGLGGAVRADSVSSAALIVDDEFSAELEVAIIRPDVQLHSAFGDGPLDGVGEAGEVGADDGLFGDVVSATVSVTDPSEHFGVEDLEGHRVRSPLLMLALSRLPDAAVRPVDEPGREMGAVEWSFDQDHRQFCQCVGVVLGEGVVADSSLHPPGETMEQNGESVRFTTAEFGKAADHLVAAGYIDLAVHDPHDGMQPGAANLQTDIGIGIGIGAGTSESGRREEFVDPGGVAVGDGVEGGFEGLVVVHVILRSLLQGLYERCEIEVPDFVPELVPDYVPGAIGGQEISRHEPAAGL